MSISLLALISASFAFSQDSISQQVSLEEQHFSLFGEVESAPNDIPFGLTRERQNNDVARIGTTVPEFTLLGTSRIGNRQSAILKHREGSEIVVVSEGLEKTPIDGHDPYSLLSVSPGRVHIQYPAGASCVDFKELGVSCAPGEVAILELKFGDPVPVSAIASAPVENSVETENNQQDNPFAILRDQIRNNEEAVSTLSTPPATSPGRSSSVRRIDPADVPPGMEIVSTPFGDRLVPED